ncbi:MULTISPECIES: hypothetical protein [unclassified Bradyrhizobium]|uniref:hypothetical protein n=1 Tax=unclassified Bradyrhizobium TaxID=2631580 RepID=UPI0029167059|nr:MULTISPECIES: hypothetical protein [unclassified Bradyrhizobium]
MSQRTERTRWAGRIAGVVIPSDGLTLNAFGTAIWCSPDQARGAARYLHNKRLVFVSEQAGVIRVFPAAKRPGRGRPSRMSVGIRPTLDPRLARLITEAAPIFYALALLLRERAEIDWREQSERMVEIEDAISVEAGRIMTLCRRSMDGRKGTESNWIRDALWLFQPAIMPVVAERHPTLARDGVLAAAEPSQAKRLPNHMSDAERVLSYVAQAGRRGITVSDIVNKMRCKRATVDDVARTLESVGQVMIVECRSASRGRVGTRLFDPKHGEPHILPDGRLVTAID